MFNEDYVISIIGRQQYEDSDPGEISIDTLGTYKKCGETRFISYTEYDENDPQNPLYSTLKVESSRVTMSKQGTATNFVLEKGKRHLCIYDTEFGPMTVGIFTSSLDSSLDDSGGKLYIKYSLDIESGAGFSSQNEICITVRPQKETSFFAEQTLKG